MSNRSTGRDLALVAVFAGVTAVLGLVPAIAVPISPAPITAQSMGIALAGNMLGGRRGFSSQLLFLALVAIGLPLLAGGRGGIGVFAGPSVGFLIGYPIVAGLIGAATARLPKYRIWQAIVINIIFGMIVLYVFGIAGMMALANLDLGAAIVANLPYLPGDLIKMILAAVIAGGVHKAYPGLLPSTGATPTRTDGPAGQ